MQNVRPSFAYVIFGLCFIAAFVRLHFGVDFTDEGLYVAIPWAFVRGAEPFLNEKTHTQLASLLLVPLVRFAYGKSSYPEGIVLFVRYLFFLMSAAQSAVVYFACRYLDGKRSYAV